MGASNEQQAVAFIVGEIANELRLTAGGLLITNILVKIPTPKGGKIPNYIPVKWFGGVAESVAETYDQGDAVVVKAEVRMNKKPGDQYYQIQLMGETIKGVKVAEVEIEDEIPW